MNSSLRTAYILQIHKNANQVNLFIRQLLSDKNADIYVHIDKKSRLSLENDILQHPRLMILDQSINCEWGDISQVDTTILLLRSVLASEQNYDFVCLRSGQDLLVREGFKEFLFQNRGRIFMTIRNSGRNNLASMKMYWPKFTRKRYTSAHPIRVYRRLLQSCYRKGVNLLPNINYWPKDYTFYNGSQWFSIPYEVAKYIISFVDGNEWYHSYFKNTMCPDEWYFHTLLMNSPYKDRIVNNNLLYLKWGESFSEANSPQNLTMQDVQEMESSECCYFARKFDEKVDNEVIQYFSHKVLEGGMKEGSNHEQCNKREQHEYIS